MLKYETSNNFIKIPKFVNSEVVKCLLNFLEIENLAKIKIIFK